MFVTSTDLQLVFVYWFYILQNPYISSNHGVCTHSSKFSAHGIISSVKEIILSVSSLPVWMPPFSRGPLPSHPSCPSETPVPLSRTFWRQTGTARICCQFWRSIGLQVAAVKPPSLTNVSERSHRPGRDTRMGPHTLGQECHLCGRPPSPPHPGTGVSPAWVAPTPPGSLVWTPHTLG